MATIRYFSLFLLLFLFSFFANAQSGGSNVLQTHWQKYDSIYYENLFRPLFSNLLMPKGYVEALVSNALVTGTQIWTDEHKKLNLGNRYSYNYLTAIVNTGFNNNTRFNAGVEMHYTMGYIDLRAGSSPFAIYGSDTQYSLDRAGAITSLGPRIKWRPFKKNFNFVWTSSFQLPLVTSDHKANIIGGNQAYSSNQFLYSFTLGKRVNLFAEYDFYAYLKKGDYKGQYVNSFTFYSFFNVSRKFYPFLSAGYSMIGFNSPQKYIPIGAGLQYQSNLHFSVTLSYSAYAWAENYTDWKTYSLGVRRVF